MRSLRLSLTLAAASALMVAGTAAQAHPKLLSASPAANATITKTAKIELHFSETLVGQFSGVDLVMTDMPGMKMNSPMKMGGVAVAVGSDGKTLVATLQRPLPAGTYKLDWHAVSADTHRVNGSYNFQVK